ncbi:hypothetical protein [uncultured Methanobrevibacter sp.]|uniref:hypothetical protein n=1 Tax=uncultured Methanobrevibacter sp. TaxID=253161 RepID=UPI0025E5D911|nr:hypothetical protein [uncultured Methanobrevibacter sp.]
MLRQLLYFFSFFPIKEPTKIKITSDKEQNEGGELSIQLTDLNKTPLSKEVVNITVTNSKGKVVVDDVVKTDSKGKAKLDLDLKKGKYNVTVTYGGNENYTGNNTTQKLTVKEKVVETQADTSSSSSSSVSQRYTTDEHGTYDNERDMYIDRQFQGSSKAEVQEFEEKIRRDGGMV